MDWSSELEDCCQWQVKTSQTWKLKLENAAAVHLFLQWYSYITFTNTIRPTDLLFLASPLAKQNIKLVCRNVANRCTVQIIKTAAWPFDAPLDVAWPFDHFLTPVAAICTAPMWVTPLGVSQSTETECQISGQHLIKQGLMWLYFTFTYVLIWSAVRHLQLICRPAQSSYQNEADASLYLTPSVPSEYA